MIVDKINEYLSNEELTLDTAIQYQVEKLAGWSFRRQFMENEPYDSTGKIWMSQCGKCPRQIAYAFHGFEKNGKDIDARSRMVFFMGDLVEIAVINLAKLAGVPLVGIGLDQARLSLPINGSEISGRPDGFIVGNPMKILNVKSMSSFAFRKFEKGDIGEYIGQVNIELAASGLDECIMVAIAKDSGVLGEHVFKRDEKVVSQLRKDVLGIVKSTKEKLPERKFEADKKTDFLPWQCLYCSYWKHCWPEAEKVVVSGKYKLKTKRLEVA